CELTGCRDTPHENRSLGVGRIAVQGDAVRDVLIQGQRHIAVRDAGNDVLVSRYIALVERSGHESSSACGCDSTGGNRVGRGSEHDVSGIALWHLIVQAALRGLVGPEETAIRSTERRVLGVLVADTDLAAAPIVSGQCAEAALV